MTPTAPPQDAIPVRCFSFHPSGDYMAVGTDHTAVRVYDIATAQCYVNPFSKEHHTNRVTSTQYGRQGGGERMWLGGGVRGGRGWGRQTLR